MRKTAMPLPASLIPAEKISENPADKIPKQKRVDISTLDDSEIKKLYPKSSPGMIKNLSDKIPPSIAKQIQEQYRNLSFLAHGSFGVVYDNGDKDAQGNDILVKITTDQDEIRSLKILFDLKKNKKYESKCIVKLHGFREIAVRDPRYKNIKSIGVLETKKLEVLNDEEKECVSLINGFIFEWNKTDINSFIRYLKYDFNRDITDLEYEVFVKYIQLKKCIEGDKNKFSTSDLNKDNIGKENNRYILIDVGGLT
jgi:hypothetical protein